MATLNHTRLGNIELSPHLRLRGLLDWPQVQFAAQRSIDGLYLYAASPAMQGGRPLTLDGSGAHFTVRQLRAILNLQAQGQPVELVHHVGSFRVLITNITSPELWIDYADYSDTDYVSATVEMVEVLE